MKDYDIDLVGEENNGFGGMSNEFILPSNISITLLMVGLLFGSVWMHHKPTIVICLAISSAQWLVPHPISNHHQAQAYCIPN